VLYRISTCLNLFGIRCRAFLLYLTLLCLWLLLMLRLRNVL